MGGNDWQKCGHDVMQYELHNNIEDNSCGVVFIL